MYSANSCYQCASLATDLAHWCLPNGSLSLEKHNYCVLLLQWDLWIQIKTLIIMRCHISSEGQLSRLDTPLCVVTFSLDVMMIKGTSDWTTQCPYLDNTQSDAMSCNYRYLQVTKESSVHGAPVTHTYIWSNCALHCYSLFA